MKIVLNPSNPFNLDVTLCCGQAFRWEKLGEWWYGVVADKVFKIRQKENALEFENVNASFVENYFGLKEDLTRILSQITKDEVIRKAVEEFKGLRILRQDPWECLISYICATYKSIPAIKKMIFKLSEKFGEKMIFDRLSFYTFPRAEQLAKANESELRECGLGYRAKYVLETAKKVYGENFNFESLRKLNYEKARAKLLELPGVGLKVADCVSLFSLGKLEAFPVDLWIKRVILKYYANHFEENFSKKLSLHTSCAKSEYEKLSMFGRKYFGEYAGYAQEYLYHYERMHSV